MKIKVLQNAANNAETLLKGKINFSPKKKLSKIILFNGSHRDKEKIIDEILEALPADNYELYVLHQPGTNAFTLKSEDGKQSENFKRSKNIFENLKN